jgi:hypothetical protein
MKHDHRSLPIFLLLFLEFLFNYFDSLRHLFHVDLFCDVPITKPLFKTKFIDCIRKDSLQVLNTLNFVNIRRVNYEKLDFSSRLNGEGKKVPHAVVRMPDINPLVLGRRHVLNV